jgi:hypothetical protein
MPDLRADEHGGGALDRALFDQLARAGSAPAGGCLRLAGPSRGVAAIASHSTAGQVLCDRSL